jgi:hypothetical protein
MICNGKIEYIIKDDDSSQYVCMNCGESYRFDLDMPKFCEKKLTTKNNNKMAEPKIYPKGMRTFAKNANAPQFVLGTLVITPKELVDWIKENDRLLTDYNGTKQLKLQILNGDKGIYFTVDTFKSKPKENLDF